MTPTREAPELYEAVPAEELRSHLVLCRYALKAAHEALDKEKTVSGIRGRDTPFARAVRETLQRTAPPEEEESS